MTRLGYLLFLFLFSLGCAGADLQRFESSDGTLIFESDEEFVKTFNPHAILSLQSPAHFLVVVTIDEKKFDTAELYDKVPSSFVEPAVCVGRVLLTVDGYDAPVFLVEGMFPPGEDSTHDTLFSVVNRGDAEYTIMLHYPTQPDNSGFEWAVQTLGQFRFKK